MTDQEFGFETELPRVAKAPKTSTPFDIFRKQVLKRNKFASTTRAESDKILKGVVAPATAHLTDTAVYHALLEREEVAGRGEKAKRDGSPDSRGIAVPDA